MLGEPGDAEGLRVVRQRPPTGHQILMHPDASEPGIRQRPQRASGLAYSKAPVPAETASRTIEVAHDLLSGKISQIDTDIENPLITRENVDQFIEIYRRAGAIK